MFQSASKYPCCKTQRCPNLQTSPEFPWTGLEAGAPTHRCWTRTWAAGEPGIDDGGGSPATISKMTEVSCEEAEGLPERRAVSADLGDRVSDYLHHCCSDVVGTGLQAAVFTQQTADIHRMQEHLLAVISWREQDKTSQHQGFKF